jgi:hypothetical protein
MRAIRTTCTSTRPNMANVSLVAHWPYWTFHRWVKTGAYRRDWGGEGALDVAVAERTR